MHKIAAVIITFNEEKNIRRCLESIRDIADEIIIIDSYSTDNTKAICSEYKVNFIEAEWLGYSKSKNLGIKRSQFSYILSLDADEELSEALRTQILQEKKKGLENAYSFNRLSNYCGKWIHHGDWYPDRKMRLWNKEDGEWEGDIHESVILKKGIKVNHLKGDIHHYSYYSIDEHIDQINKYSGLSANDLRRRNKKAGFIKLVVSPYIQFGRSYIIKLGFLDGFEGFAIALITAFGTFLKYAKLRKMN